MPLIAVISSDAEEREMLVGLFPDQSVLSFQCVVSAIEAARVAPPALFLCGISLMQLGVEELFKLTADFSELSAIPVVSLTLDSSRRLELRRAGCAAVVELPAENEEIALVVAQILKRIESSGFRGTFADVALIDLVQLLASSRSNGVLDVDVTDEHGAGEHGELAFDDGQLIHAKLNGDVGELAVLHLLRRARHGGGFIFERGEVSQMKTIDKRTDHLLLGLASQIDEDVK
jgi:CheY-like chemotaxis protein